MDEKDNTEGGESKVEQTTASSGVSPSRKKSSNNIAIAVVIVVFAIFVVLNFTGTINVLNLQPAAVTINGEKIKQSEVNNRMDQILSSPQAQGVDTTDPTILAQVRDQVLNELINTALLLQAAEEAGVVTDSEAIEAEYQIAVTQLGGEDALKQQLSDGGTTEAEFRANLADQLAIREYLEANTTIFSVSVTDEEVGEFYEQVSATQEGVPPLSEIRSQVEGQLIANKQQVELDAFVTTLRDAAEIEIK